MEVDKWWWRIMQKIKEDKWKWKGIKVDKKTDKREWMKVKANEGGRKKMKGDVRGWNRKKSDEIR